MLGIRYVKVPPTVHVIQYVAGRVKRSGVGLSFFYYAPTSEIVQVPLTSVDVPFAFTEVTSDYQDVTVQGELTYRIGDPARAAKVLDFGVDAAGRYRSEDPTKLGDRLVRPAQALTRVFTQQRKLHDLLLSSAALSAHVLTGVRDSDSVSMLGAEVLAFNILKISPTPEMGKAIQADAREELLRRADQAVYARRNAAVELERSIKENELNTAILVEQKQRQVHETKMAADTAVEEQRAALVEHRVTNQRKEADARAYAVKAVVEALQNADWKTLAAVDGLKDARANIALAFRELAENAQRIEHLNITPDLLGALLQTPRAAAAPAGKA